MEKNLLSVILHERAAYVDIRPTLDMADFSDIGKLILEEIEEYYAADAQAMSVDKDIVVSRLERKYPHHIETLRLSVEALLPVSVPNVLNEYVDLRIHSIGRRLATAISSSSEEAMDLLHDYEFLVEKREEALIGDDKHQVYEGVDIEDIFKELSADNLIQLAPPSLNETLGGGVIRGMHIVVYARPETGKSLFNLNLTARLLEQGLRVLYIGNEDPAAALRQRIVSSLLGMERRDILANPKDVETRLYEAGYENLVFVSLSPGSVNDVRGLVRKYKPDVFIVDQIRNLYSSKNLTKVESLEYIAQCMRNLAKETNAVGISVTQAGASAEGKLVLGLNDVDFSNTGIPSTADLMIGLGTTVEYDKSNRRVLSLPKNKISGEHSSITISVDPVLSRVSDEV